MAKAIIVDDSKFMRKIIRETLEAGGHEILAEGENGYEGIEAFKKHKPDFITMDITMGGKDGMMAVKEIMEIDNTARVIVISALNENTIKMNDQNVNAVAYVTKPFEKKELLETIEQVLN